MIDALDIPAAWLPPANAKRIITHWTGGAYRASDIDKEHYHFLIQADLQVIRGRWTPADQDSTKGGRYAAHTRRKNTASLGIAVCAMAGATPPTRAGAEGRPAAFGPFPMSEDQWTRMAQLAAILANRYNIPVVPETVLGHGEVERLLRVAQRGKWDPLVLPWNTDLSMEEAGDLFRVRVREFLRFCA